MTTVLQPLSNGAIASPRKVAWLELPPGMQGSEGAALASCPTSSSMTSGSTLAPLSESQPGTGSKELPAVRAAAAAAAAVDKPAQQPSSSAPPSPHKAALAQERHRRTSAEALSTDLRRQLDDIATVLLSAKPRAVGAPPTTPTPLAAAQALVQECAALRQDASLFEGRLHVARMVAGICSRAGTTADLQAAWQEERRVLLTRLEQAAQLGAAMLRHKQQQQQHEPEPWRQQLVHAALAVGCSALGAAAAVAIIRGL